MEILYAAEAAKKALDNKFLGAQRGYLRFNDLPERRKSRNYATGTLEAGVSVFSVEYSKGGDYRLINSNPALTWDLLTYEANNATKYRVWGDIVGTGSDGEPLLSISKFQKL